MRHLFHTAAFLFVVSPLARAADPTPAELKDIKQLSEDIFGLPKRKEACERLGDYGPKAWSAIPNLSELLTAGKEKDSGVVAAAATALGRIGGTAVTKTLSEIAGKHEMAEVRTAALVEVVRIAPADANTARLTKTALTDIDRSVRRVAALTLLRSAGKAQSPVEAVQVAKGLLASKPGDNLLGASDRFDPTKLWLAFAVLEVPAARAELKDEIENVFAAHVNMAQFRGFRGGDALGLLFGIPPEELRRKGEEERARYETRSKLIADEFVVGAEKAGPDGRVVLARGFLRACQELQKHVPAALEARDLIASLRNDGTSFERATAAAALAAVEKEDRAEVIKSLEAALKDDSPLVAAVAKEALARLAKK